MAHGHEVIPGPDLLLGPNRHPAARHLHGHRNSSQSRLIVESVIGKLCMPDAVDSLRGEGETLATNPNVMANSDKFAKYALAKSKVDWTAPFKALANA